MTSTLAPHTHLARLAAAREQAGRSLSDGAVARILDPTGTFPAYALCSPYFYVGPKRPRPTDVIRLVCKAEDRNPVEGEVLSLGGTTTRVAYVAPHRLFGGRLHVSFGDVDGRSGSCCVVVDRERAAVAA